MEKKRAIIIGAAPVGLTAAYEFLQRTDIVPLILEQSGKETPERTPKTHAHESSVQEECGCAA